ncbi:MAG TPA: hypothetical protein VIL24_04765 [Clostridia bacterium]
MAERKGWLYRWTMGRDDNPDFTLEDLPSNRWEVFKDVLFNRFGTLVKINLLMIIFALPAVVWYYLTLNARSVAGMYINYTVNFGFGYPFVKDVPYVGQLYNLQQQLWSNLVMVPLMMIASIGMAGGFHAIKMLVWGEGVAVVNTFFKGIKSNIVPFLWSTLILGLAFTMVQYNISAYGLYSGPQFLSVMSLVASIIFFVILVFMTVFIYTQAATYKISLWGLIKNSFLFAIGLLFHNIFFVGITALPLILFLLGGPEISLIILLFYALVGVSMTILIWTLYSHYVFDKYLNDKIEGAIKDRGIYRKSKEEIARKRKEAEERRKKAANTKFVNPKKRKRSIDEGKSITPLEVTFSREDLKRLAEEKKQLESEALDSEAENDEVDITTEESES